MEFLDKEQLIVVIICGICLRWISTGSVLVRAKISRESWVTRTARVSVQLTKSKKF